MNKLEQTVGALLVSTALGCSRPEDKTVNVLIHQIVGRAQEIAERTCHVEPDTISEETSHKINCGAEKNMAYFSVHQEPNQDMHYTFQYGVPKNRRPTSVSPTLSVTLTPQGRCETIEATNIRIRIEPDTRMNLHCAQENGATDCTIDEVFPEETRTDISPDDAAEICTISSALVVGMQRTIEKAAK